MMCMRNVVLLALLLSALLSGVCQAASLPKELKENGTSIKLGDPIEKVLGFFGPPTRIAANGENYCWRDWYNMKGPELIIKTRYGKNMWAIVVDRVPMVRTPEGIGVGSTKEEIVAQYGETKDGYTDVNGDIVMSYGGKKAEDLFLRFRLSGKKEKRVVYMILGNPGVKASSGGRKKK